MAISLPQLQTGTCLGQLEPNSIDVAIPQGPIQTIHCEEAANIGSYTQLGRKVWFSEEEGQLTWEIVEDGYGGLVYVNLQRLRNLFEDALEIKGIPELSGYGKPSSHIETPVDFVFESEEKKVCHVAVEAVWLCDEIHRGFYPNYRNFGLCEKIKALIRRRYEGDEAMLILLVANTRVNQVYLADQVDPQVGALLRDAQEVGVTIPCYRVDIQENFLRVLEKRPFISY